MRCPTLSELPPPPPGRNGWPWTEESPRLPDTTPDGSPWPLISIVTPSYNQGRFIEETIRSVLLQGYPNLEYIVVDGGSTDDSVQTIRRYEQWLRHWVSEPDAGQADAIGRGFAKATGEILAYINSDDYYLPGVLAAVEATFRSGAEWTIGHSIFVDREGQLLRKRWCPPVTFNTLLFWRQGFSQPTAFWRREAFLSAGGIDTTLQFCLDYDLFIRLAQRDKPKRVKAFIAAVRIHPESKTSTMDAVRKAESYLLHVRYGRYERHPLLVMLMEQRCKLSFRLWSIGLKKILPILRALYVRSTPSRAPRGRNGHPGGM